MAIMCGVCGTYGSIVPKAPNGKVVLDEDGEPADWEICPGCNDVIDLHKKSVALVPETLSQGVSGDRNLFCSCGRSARILNFKGSSDIGRLWCGACRQDEVSQ